MHRLILFFSLYLTTTNLAAQVITTLHDQFDYTDQTWTNSIWDDPTYYRGMENGHYHMEHRDPKGKYISFKNIYIEPNRPFAVEADLVMTTGEPGSGIALYLRGEKTDWYMFEVRPAGKSYWAGIYKSDGTVDYLNKATSSDNGTISQAIKGLKELNQLRVEWKEREVVVSINNKIILQIPSEKYGNAIPQMSCIGFQSSGISKFYIDNVKVLQEIKDIKLAKETLKDFKRVKLQTAVNSDYSERTPVITHDGKRLYFIRNAHPQNTFDINKDDAWYSDLSHDTIYSMAKNMATPLNNNMHNSVISVSADNNSMMMLGVYNPDGSYKENGMSITKSTSNGWTVPEKLEIEDFYNLGKHIEACLSYEGKVLILAIQRKDALGMNDLYVSFKNDKGNYSQPKHMGAVINTVKHEITPFLAGDGKSLYFSSEGRKGFGGFDVFVSKRLDDTWLNWSEPINLGPSVNTSGYDAFFSIPANGKYAYMVGDMSGNLDIYRLQVTEENKPEPIAVVFGKVLNGKNNLHLMANVEVTELETDKTIEKFTSAEKDGAYTILLQKEKKYAFRAVKDGFYPVSKHVDLTTIKVSTEIKENLLLFPIEKGQTIRLNNVFFDVAKSSLQPQSFPEVNRVVALLNENKEMKIEISGHTDHVGNDALNLKLSDERAKSVVNYLISKGISLDRLFSKGYGENKPIDTNESEAGRANNRRVEFTIK